MKPYNGRPCSSRAGPFMNPLEISPEQFRRLAHRVTDLAAGYLESLPVRETFPAEVTGAAVNKVFDAPLPRRGAGEAALDQLADVLRLSRPPSPRFFGYVLGSGD